MKTKRIEKVKRATTENNENLIYEYTDAKENGKTFKIEKLH